MTQTEEIEIIDQIMRNCGLPDKKAWSIIGTAYFNSETGREVGFAYSELTITKIVAHLLRLYGTYEYTHKIHFPKWIPVEMALPEPFLSKGETFWCIDCIGLLPSGKVESRKVKALVPYKEEVIEQFKRVGYTHWQELPEGL